MSTSNKLLVLLALLLLAIGLAACGQQVSTPEEQAAADEEPTEVSEVTPTDPPTEAPPTATLVPSPTPISGCLECHQDAELLKTLAVEEESGESLSEGEG